MFQPNTNAPVANRSPKTVEAVMKSIRSVDSVIVSGRGSGMMKLGGTSTFGYCVVLLLFVICTELNILSNRFNLTWEGAL